MKRMREYIRGFTLVEVIILLLIIALLLAMALPALQKVRQAKWERAQSSEAPPPAAPARP
ncbi:MAG: prepilin-type N-terminal cleavage/methylation domain-containing protein [Opitutaceae bacterium]|jgi:type IV pilus assembly protein PilA